MLDSKSRVLTYMLKTYAWHITYIVLGIYYGLLYFSIKSYFKSQFQKASLYENVSFKISNKLYHAISINCY